MNNADILEHVFAIEGWPAYTNRPNDRGGPTKGGITINTLSDWLGRQATIAELQVLSKEAAEQIYTGLFITSPGFWRIADDLLRWQVVDCGILSGPERATTWLQDLVGGGLKVDGRMGPMTAAAINARDAHQLGVRLAAQRIRFLGRLITNDRQRDQRENAHGWMNRATRFLDLEAARGEAE